MLRTLAALAAVSQLVCFADDLPVQGLTLKAFEQAIASVPLKTPIAKLARPTETLVCAIPLKEVRAGSGKRVDPMVLPPVSGNIDKIARPAPIQACPSESSK